MPKLPPPPSIPARFRDAIDYYGETLVGKQRDEDDPLFAEYETAFDRAHDTLVACLADLLQAARLGRHFVETVAEGHTTSDDPKKLLAEITALMGEEG